MKRRARRRTALEREIDAAVASLTRRIKNRGDADIEVIAREFVAVELVHLRGWRPAPVPARRRPATPPTPAYLRARAALDASANP